MKTVLRKAAALMIVFVMLFCSFSSAFTAEEAASDDESLYYNGVYYYCSGIGFMLDDPESADRYSYSDDYFKAPGNIYNEHLATMSMSACAASISSSRESNTDEGYTKKSRNLSALFEDIGFSDIEVNDDYRLKPTRDSAGLLCAHKKISENGKEHTLIAVVPRCAGYEAEWANNFVIGSTGDSNGFSDCAGRCLSFVKDYISENRISGAIKVWITGYSRGAAIAELMAKELIDSPSACLGESVSLDRKNLYAYTFAASSAADVNNEPRDERYAGIFNSYENTELASAMPPGSMGFDRCGTDRVLNNEEKFEEMLSYLKVYNKTIHNIYTDTAGSYMYVPKKLIIENGTVSIADDNDSYLPYSASEFIYELGEYLTKVTGGRKNYTAVYEKPISDILAYSQSLAGSRSSAFYSALTSHEDLPFLITAMYAYFIKLNNSSASNKTQLAETAAQISAVAAAADGSAETSAYSSLITKLTLKLTSYLLKKPEAIKKEAAGYLGNILGAAMNAAGATDEEKKNILSESSLSALTQFISHLLFGNIRQKGNMSALDMNNQAIKNAATVIGNALNLVMDHTNEIVLSWLRTEDSYYNDCSELTRSQIKGYRRLYISAPEKAVIKGRIVDGEGNEIAVIENGKLISSVDRWVGFTDTDEGGFYRIPSDKSYYVYLTCREACDIDFRIDEYSCSDGKSVKVMDKKVSAGAYDNITVKLPALMGDYTSPSGAKYNAYAEKGPYRILGDADGDGEVTAADATIVQRATVQLPVEIDTLAADTDRDGDITIIDATFIQRYATRVRVPMPIGEPIE